MENILTNGLIVLAILFLLFLLLRELNCWYWKINERNSAIYKTNFLLEKISMQLGASGIDEITVEEIETGRREKMGIDVWIKFKMNNPKVKGYRVVKDDMPLEKK